MSNWLVEHRCKSCGNRVTETQRYYSACCPHCGDLADCTILNTTTHVYREKVSYQDSNARIWWWQFWIPKQVKVVTRVYKDAD